MHIAESCPTPHPPISTPYLRASLNPFCHQPDFGLGITLTQVQHFALGLVELHEVHIGLLIGRLVIEIHSLSAGVRHPSNVIFTVVGICMKPADFIELGTSAMS